MDYRLGLDVGTNSVGWSVLELDGSNNPCRVEGAGVRIFSEGRNPKDKATLKAERRVARSARRRRDRFKQRQKYLLSELTKHGLFPSNEEERKALQLFNPLELRAKALTEKLPLHHIGRALFHLNQRRGFKSNRKDRSEETTGGKVSGSVRALLEQMGLIGAPLSKEEYKELPSREEKRKAREKEAADRREAYSKLAENNQATFGLFLWNRQQKGLPIRARPAGDSKLYDVYPDRQLLEDEFNKIWASQSKHHSEVLTKIAREKIREVIFYQRPLKIPERGRCAYLTEETRTFRAMPTFQRYRIYQEVNNLEWATSEGKSFLNEHREARDQIVGLLETPKTDKGNVSFQDMKKCLKKLELAEGNFQLNYETPKRRGFDGNLTSHALSHEDCVGQVWHEWSLEKQDEFVAVILDDSLEDEQVYVRLVDEYGLTQTAAENCVNAQLVEGTASLSLQAARLLLEKMRDELMIQSDAVEALAEEKEEFVNPFTRSSKRKLLEQLPYYGEAFQDGRHIIPGSRSEKDENDDLKFYGGITNPTVHIALNQIRRVVNELIMRYGHPTSIAVELGRELPAGKERRREIEKRQAKNQADNERIDDILEQQGLAISPDNRLRLKLWEELGEDPNDRRCPYSGDKIEVADLFSERTEIDHIVPFSSSLDDGRVNKVICTRQANRHKGKRTPHQAFSDSPGDYNWHEIFERAKKLNESSTGKLARFSEDAAEKFGDESEDFTERHLNDTRYIGRLVKEYLEYICPYQKIDVCTGRLTYLLRKHWGLNSVLRASSDNEPKKNRDDHRHHAVDAIVVGMTTRSILQRVSTEANRAEDLDLNRLFVQAENGKSQIDPWDGFRNEVVTAVQSIVVSHKVRRKKLTLGVTDGQLHNETAYSVKSGPDENGYYQVAWRRPIAELCKNRSHLETVVDKRLRSEAARIFDEKGKDGVIHWAKEQGIRRLRCRTNLKVILVKDTLGHPYKAYKGDSNWGIEIYEYPSTCPESGKWVGAVITRFQANQRDFKFGHTCKPHPAARLVMRLQINDCVEMEYGGNACIMRLQKINQNGAVMEFAPHNEANVDRRNRDRADPFKYFRKTPNALRSIGARKVHISPAGLVNYEARGDSMADGDGVDGT